MKMSKKIFAGMAALVLSFGFVLTGCESTPSSSAPAAEPVVVEESIDATEADFVEEELPPQEDLASEGDLQ